MASDETGTSVAYYFKEFGGRATPWGTTASEILDGNKYDNIFWTRGGSDVITTHEGVDQINVLQGKLTDHDVVKVTDFDLAKDSLIFKNFTGGTQSVTTFEQSDGVHISHSNGQSEVVLQRVSLQQFNDAGGVQKLVHFSSDFQMTWDGSTEGNKVLVGFNPDYDKLVAANGGAFKHLLLKGVYGADGQAYTKITFAHDNQGWEGGGYLLPIDVEFATCRVQHPNDLLRQGVLRSRFDRRLGAFGQ